MGLQRGDASRTSGRRVMARSVRPRILIADSYRSHAEILSAHLKELSPDIEVYRATAGREALSEIEERNIHLFLVNGFLKGPLNGFELCRSIRKLESHRHTPIVLMLSGHLIHDHRRGLASGVDLFLHTPAEKQELWRMVVLLLNEFSHRTIRDAGATDDAAAEVIELKPSMRILH